MIKSVIAGIFLAVIIFLLLLDSNDIWLITIITTIVSAIFILLLFLIYTPKSLSVKNKIIIYISLFTFFALSSVLITHQYYQSNWQKRSLLKAKKTIGYSSLQGVVKRNLTNIFLSYHQQSPQNTKTIGQLFDEMFIKDSSTIENLAYFKEEFETNLSVISHSDNEVVLCAEQLHTPGKNYSFENLSGEKGNIQVRGILNKDAIKYEIQN